MWAHSRPLCSIAKGVWTSHLWLFSHRAKTDSSTFLTSIVNSEQKVTSYCKQCLPYWYNARQTSFCASSTLGNGLKNWSCNGNSTNALQWMSLPKQAYTAHLVICTPTCTSEHDNYLTPPASPPPPQNHLPSASWPPHSVPKAPQSPTNPTPHITTTSTIPPSHHPTGAPKRVGENAWNGR